MRAARPAVIALILWPVAVILQTTLAVGHYEDRITVVTHGDVDVLPAWMAYELLKELTSRGAAAALADSSWVLASLVAIAALVAWLLTARDVRRVALVAVLLGVLCWLYQVTVADGGRFEGGALDTRIVVYPLWTITAAMVAVASVLGLRVVRRNTA